MAGAGSSGANGQLRWRASKMPNRTIPSSNLADARRRPRARWRSNRRASAKPKDNNARSQHRPPWVVFQTPSDQQALSKSRPGFSAAARRRQDPGPNRPWR